MKRTLFVLTIGAVGAACGLSVQGLPFELAPDDGSVAATGVDGGPLPLPDGRVPTSGDDDDVDANTGPKKDAAVADTSAPLEGRPDARPPAPASCYRPSCATAGEDCSLEQCDTSNGSHWLTLKTANGGSMNNTGGYCNSATNAAGQFGMMEAVKTLPASGAYEYGLQVIMRTVGTSTTSRLADLVVGATRISLVADGSKIRLCKSTAGADVCSGSVDYMATTNTPVLVYGRMSRGGLYGTAILQVRPGTSTGPGAGDCAERASLDLDGPFDGATMTARIGCVSGGQCTFDWWDGRFTIAPRP